MERAVDLSLVAAFSTSGEAVPRQVIEHRRPLVHRRRGGDYVAQLVVNDGTVDSVPDTVFIQAVEIARLM